jgi:hypothetical protein
MQSKPGRTKISRIVFLGVCLAIFISTVALPSGYLSKASAAVQKAGRRTSGASGSAPAKSSTSRLPARKSKAAARPQQGPNDYVPGVLLPGEKGIEKTTDEIMQAQTNAPASSRFMKPERELEEREERPQNPNAKPIASFPDPNAATRPAAPVTPNIHTTGLSFDGATLTDTGAFPPDSMGAVGPTQFITFVNGRLRTFTKAGVADGVINADPDVFFASVMTPVSPPVLLNFTSDALVRYDRFSGRWFLAIIDVPCTNATCTTTAPNRFLLAVSDAASNGTITGSTVWTFFQFQGSPGTDFLDYPSLGIDANALYTGGNMFTSAGSFVGTNGYVIQKSSVLGAGPMVVTLFAGLVSGATGAGPFSPRGVDNFDSTATEGYFVGVDNATFSTLMFRRVSNPGSLTPTISGNISVTVPTTTFPNRVEHAGNTGGLNGGLDSLDDRLYEAMIRNGRLWTAHNFRVNATGVASTVAASRNATRWYEFQNLTTTPTLVQSGTVFDNAATRAAARQYFIPSVTVNGQGHAVLGFTAAGTPIGPTPAYVGRLAGDTLGTMVGPPTVAAVTFGTTTANYNPPSDPGGAAGRRWGDYSFTSVDPLDDMTIWTIQEYNQALNSYAVRVARLAAPPPATPSSSAPPSIATGQASVSVTITGTSSGGSGFYDPGANLPAPALPFNHISASVTGGVTVNSVTYNSPTSVTLSLNTTAASAGLQNVTITNPDGQSATGTNILTITGPACTLTCPGNITVSNDTNQCAAVVTYANPTTSGTCGTVTCSPASGAMFPVGTTTVNCSEPGGGNCSFTVTVNYTQVPTITPGGPTTFCAGGSVTLTSNSASGNQWNLNGNPIGGATNQTFVATASGNYTVTVTIGACSSTSAVTTVTVNPTPPTPTITPGGPTTFCAGGSVTLTSSSATGNQWYLNGNPIGGATNQTFNATASGSYTVVVTASGCSSAPSSATVVTVNPAPPTPTITPGGPTTFCAGGSVTLTSSSATGNQWYLNGNPIGGETNQTYVATASGNYTVVVTASGCPSAPSAPTTVTVNPIPPTPTITPGGPTTFCAGGSVTLTSSSATGNQWYLNGNPIGGATNQTFNATASGNYTVIVTSSGCSSAPSSTTTVTVNPLPPTPTVTPGGPTTFCAGGSVTLTSSSATGNQWYLNGNPIGGATNQTFVATASGSYTVVVTASGCPSAPSAATTVTVNPIPPTPTITPGGPTTFCPGGSVTLTSSSATGNQWYLNGNPIGGATNQTFNATASGSYTVVVTASGCSSAPSAAVTVSATDTTPPTVTCPGNITTTTSANQCTAVVNYTTPTGSDNCTLPANPVVCSPPAGSVFSKGTTTVTCTVTDASNLTGTCAFTVTVNDNQNPTLSCPPNQTVNVVSAPATVTYPAPTASDNCPGVGTPICTPASGSMFATGTTTVNCSVSDAAGNPASCSFTVTVIVCTLSCPANITVSNAANQCGAVVTFAPTATPGCGTVTCSPASGSFFPKGTTTVTCNSTAGPSCSFTVTVNDTQPPVITCPANQTAIITAANATCVVVNYTTTASDNCPGVSVVCNPPAGTCFALGVTTVNCTATDAVGNTATCSFTVSVFDVCIQDDSNPGTVILLNTATGAYRFCCNGTTYTGTGVVVKKGNVVTLDHTIATRKVYAKVDRGTYTGTAWLQQPPGTNLCSITDRDIRNNTCNCQ